MLMTRRRRRRLKIERRGASPLSRVKRTAGESLAPMSLDGGGDCLLDALPVDVIDAEIASRHPWIVHHLAMAYKRYADYCRRAYAVLPDDAIRRWRLPAYSNITCAFTSSVFNDVAVNCVALPADHPRLFSHFKKESIDKLVEWRDDKLVVITPHCLAGDGPSVTINAGFVLRHRYGALHDGPHGVPAVYHDAACQSCAVRVCRREWYRCDKRHRDDDLPAIVLLTIATDDGCDAAKLIIDRHLERHMRRRRVNRYLLEYGNTILGHLVPTRIDTATRDTAAYFSTAWRGGVKRAEIDGVAAAAAKGVCQWWRDGTFRRAEYIDAVAAAPKDRWHPQSCCTIA